MKCPYCGNGDTKVLDTRNMEDNSVIRRRRLCEECGERFTTFERVEIIQLQVVKSDNSREPFNRNKILKGIIMSCNKRPVSTQTIETMVSEIENTLLNSMKKEVYSKEIGELVMEKLKDVDEIAYVRFASVYRQFKDIDSFMSELGKMLKEKK